MDEAGIGIKERGDVPQTTSSLIFVMERRRGHDGMNYH